MATSSPSSPDLATVKQSQQVMWSRGDYAAIATPLQIVSETLCEAADLRAGSTVLDVACGSGNTAIAAARRFCTVTGVDYVPALLDRAQKRAAAERLPVHFELGDAEHLPYPDASFDVVLSSFGAMFAADQPRAAAEMIRVARHGGTIGMANWTPDGWFGTVFSTIAHFAPPPPGVKPPLRWGTEDGLRDLFGDRLADLRIERREFILRYRSPAHWLEFFRTNFGPMVNAFAALDAMGRQLLADELSDRIAAANTATDGTLVVPASYLEVIATRH
jgi:SAM-dependent methyltransferase